MTKRPVSPGKGNIETRHSAIRALLILEALNRRVKAFVRELAHDTGFSKPTVVRVLQLLVDHGYVLRIGEGGLYAPAARVSALSSGFRTSSQLLARARPLMRRFTADNAWPVAFGVLDLGAILVEYSTTPDSPMAWYKNTRGARLALANSAMGLATLAFLPRATSGALLEALPSDVEFAAPLDLGRLPATLKSVRAQGYAVRRPSRAHPTSSIAVPVLLEGYPVAALSVTVFGRAMPPERAAEQYAPALRDLAARVAKLATSPQ